MNLAELASRQATRLRDERERNRERFPFAAEMLDVLKAGGIDARIMYAENAAGETIGNRDASPVVDWTLIARIKAWNDRVFGRTVTPEPAPKRRNMTAAQVACLRGDV